MGREPKNFKIQLISTDANGNQTKRNFNNANRNLTVDDLEAFAHHIGMVLSNEKMKSMNFTENSSLKLV